MSRLHAIYLIGKRDFMDTFNSRSIYIVLFFSFLTMSLMIPLVVKDLRNSDPPSNSSNVIVSIFMTSVVGVAFLYLAAASVTTIANEKRDKTLEVLFYGPVDEISFIVGKLIGKLSTYIFLLVLSILFIFLTSLFLQFGLSFNLLKIAVLSVFLLSCIISLGIFLSTFTSSTAESIALLIGFFIGLSVLQIISSILNFIPDFNPDIVIIRKFATTLINNTRYISPIEYLFIGWESIKTDNNIKYLMSSLYSIAYSMAFLALSIILLKKKGIKQ